MSASCATVFSRQTHTNHVAVKFGWDSNNFDVTKTPGKGYIDGLESRLRCALCMNRDLFLGMTVEKTVSRDEFVSLVSERLIDVDDSASSSGPFIKIISLDVSKDSVDSVLRKITRLDSTTQQWPFTTSGFPKSGRTENTHVTVAHYSLLTQDAMRSKFQSLVGMEIEVRVTGLQWNERVAALVVKVPTASLGGVLIPEPLNPFPHITVWHGVGVSPSESNELPRCVDAGLAHSQLLHEEVSLTGKVSFWGMHQH
jgi:Fungal tRNA ligase phosphodiesterase domain